MIKKMFNIAIFSTALSFASVNIFAQSTCASGFSVDELVGDNVIADIPAEGLVPSNGEVLDLSEGGEATLFKAFYQWADGNNSLGSWRVNADCAIEMHISSSGLLYRYVGPSQDYTELSQRYGFAPEVEEFFIEAGFFQSVVVKAELLSVKISRQDDNSAGTTVSVRSEYRYTIDEQTLDSVNWNGDIPVGEAVESVEKRFYTAASRVSVLPVDKKVRGSWSIPIRTSVSDDVLQGFSDLFVFQGLGNQVRGIKSGKEFRWSQSSSAVTLFNDDESYRVEAFANEGSLYSALVTHFVNGQLNSKYQAWMVKVQGNAINFPGRLVQNIPKVSVARINSWRQSSIADDNKLAFSDVYGYAFKSDGSMTRVFSSASGFECIDASSACYQFENSISWTWQASISQVVLTGVFDGGERVRTWDVLSSAGGKTVLLESSTRRIENEDGELGSASEYIASRINVLTNFDLTDHPDPWFNTRQPEQRSHREIQGDSVPLFLNGMVR